MPVPGVLLGNDMAPCRQLLPPLPRPPGFPTESTLAHLDPRPTFWFAPTINLQDPLIFLPSNAPSALPSARLKCCSWWSRWSGWCVVKRACVIAS